MIKGNITGYLTMNKVIEQFIIFEDFNELTRYDVTEEFGDKSPRTYSLWNLKGEIENLDDGNKIVCFSDAEELIYEGEMKVLMGFLESSVLEIAYSTDNGVYEVELTFRDGTINIVANYTGSLQDADYHTIEELRDSYDDEMDKLYQDYYANDDGIY
jgi:hypothetical protein